MFCYRCRRKIELGREPERNETCPDCASFLHCCLNCQFYDKFAHNQCRESQAERVKDKEMGNYCDFFKAKEESGGEDDKRKEEALNKLNQLFKNQSKGDEDT